MDITNLSIGAEEFTSNVWGFGDVLVDVGEGGTVLDRIRERDVATVVVTHSHHDHVDNLPAVVERHDPAVYAPDPSRVPVEAEELTDGDELELAGVRFRVIATPGHRDDHVCLYAPAERVLFSGDLLFPGGAFGRTDLDEGDRDTLIASIERIADLDVVEMYAGHGDAATRDVNAQIRASLDEARKHEPKYPDG